MTAADAYAAYLAAIEAERTAIEAERTAIEAVLAADDAEPFDQAALDEADAAWSRARAKVGQARNAWYVAIGQEHNPEKIRL